jgi:PAS domain-containing protein
MERKNARMRTNLKSTDLGSISSVLEDVYLPAVLCSLPNDTVLVWNSAFQKKVGLSQDELARTPLTSLLILEENEGDLIMEGHDAKRDNQLLPCVLKNPLTDVHGQALRCDDGMLLAILGVTLGDLVLKGFDQGRRLGCDDERNRTRHFFHEVLSSRILVASFLAHEIYQKLSASGAEETEDMARLTKLLQEAIDAIVDEAEAY